MEESKYETQGNRMLYENKKLFTAKGLIENYVIISEGIVVLIDSSKSKDSQNVYCYNFNGELKWQIPPADKLHFDNYYTSIYSILLRISYFKPIIKME
jgi:hypothetical protein